MVLLIGVTVTFVSLMGYYLLGSSAVSESPDERINIDENYDSVILTVERNENVGIIAVSIK